MTFPTLKQEFGEDTIGVKLISTKTLQGFYSFHQSMPDDFVETKTHYEVKFETDLKNMCKEFNIDWMGDEE